MAAFEYRVVWRRRNWRPDTTDQVRVFARKHAAEAFLAKLTGKDRPDLAPVEVRLTHRPVTPWRDGW